MRVQVNKGIISLSGKYKESEKVKALSKRIVDTTAQNEWLKLHIVEASEGFCSVLDEAYMTLGYNPALYTVSEVKEIIKGLR